MRLFLLLALAPCVVLGCVTGLQKNKAGATKAKCASDAASCAAGATCCEDLTTTCYALRKGTPAFTKCGTDKFLDAAKDKTTAGTTEADKIKNCCSAVATCKDATCAAGWKAKTSAAATKCTGNAASCVQATCCEKDNTKCGGLTVTCATGTYLDTKKAGAAATTANAATNCCTAKATCKDATCAAGWKAKTSAAATKCDGNAASCVQATCCDKDTTKCGGLTVTCATGTYLDAKKAGAAATAATSAKNCCTAVATCQQGWDLAKKKLSAGLRPLPTLAAAGAAIVVALASL